jgi:acylphosphatase
MKKLYEIRVFGKVQGVWFRKNTQAQASSLGILGFVRNEPDGSVWIHAEGDQVALEKLLKWCEKGPELAEVIDVILNVLPVKGYSSFQIR